MAINVEPLNETDSIILWEVGARWNLTDYTTALEETARLIQGYAPRSVDIILDMSRTLIFPSDVIQAIIREHYEAEFESNYGVSVIVTTAPTIRALFSLFASSPFTRDRILLATSIAKAVVMIKQRRLRVNGGSNGDSGAPGMTMAFLDNAVEIRKQWKVSPASGNALLLM